MNQEIGIPEAPGRYNPGSNGSDKLAAENLLHTFTPGSRSRVFVNPGKGEVLELLMRTVFRNEQQAVAAVLLYDKCVKYAFQRGQDDLKSLLAARCSVEGRSTALALMAETGVVAPSVLSKEKMISNKRTRKDGEDT
jgi:hypothetical protein